MAARYMEKAAEKFQSVGETHRMLRALINGYIFRRDLGEYVAGNLFALEQECLRNSHFDLAGFIARGRAIELCTQGEFEKARIECAAALEQFKLDGCPEDRALCVALMAILCKLCGDDRAAATHFSSIPIQAGRVASYIAIYKSLENGLVPKLDASHTLAATPWKSSVQFILKSNSSLGRILRVLSKGPREKNELIEQIWGAKAGGPVYENRLRVALTKLRKSYGVAVKFDGGRYSM